MSYMENQLLLLRGDEINHLLKGQEAAIMTVVEQAYRAHANGNTIMPPNGYLHFPGMEKERIIAKAAFLGEHFQEAGLKWIASFPNNLSKSMERASATLILNSVETGRPTAIFESSVISAKRTAAGAALAAKRMSKDPDPRTIGLVGTGLINFETLRFLLHVFPSMEKLYLRDLSRERAEQFQRKALTLWPSLEIVIANDLRVLIAHCPIIAFGTTAVKPFIDSIEGHLPHLVILHTSLRDLTEEVILHADNVVDDIDQVCSNKTSLHLAQRKTGDRAFIRATIGDILNGRAGNYDEDKKVHIFSPFGLGILDLAVGNLVKNLALEQKAGTVIDGFLPRPWIERD